MFPWRGCDDGGHDFTEAYDEVPNERGMKFDSSEMTEEVLHMILYRKVLRAIYCKRCGKQLETP